jgi:hypothetical protein
MTPLCCDCKLELPRERVALRFLNCSPCVLAWQQAQIPAHRSRPRMRKSATISHLPTRDFVPRRIA